MNVLFNAESLLMPLAGIGQYVLQLFSALQAHCDLNLYSYYPNQLKEGLIIPSVPKENQKNIQTYLKKKLIPFLIKMPFQRDLRHAIAPYLFQKRCKNLPANTLYHEPSFVCLPFEGPKAVTIHDLSTFDCPKTHPQSRVRFLEKKMPQSLNEAAKIFVVSHFTKERLQHWFNVEDSKIVCTHLGAREGFYPRNRNESASTLEKYNLKSKSYIFALGTLEPRKNLNTLFEAFTQLPSPLQEHFPLVVAGQEGWMEKGILKAAIPLVQKGRVRFLGFVPDDELPFLLSQCAAFSYPSLYEGFGLPLLEALSCGAPSVVSNAASLPEVAGHAALFHDPQNSESIKTHLTQILEDPIFAENLSQKGVLRAQNFSWQKCAEETFKTYRQILAC